MVALSLKRANSKYFHLWERVDNQSFPNSVAIHSKSKILCCQETAIKDFLFISLKIISSPYL